MSNAIIEKLTKVADSFANRLKANVATVNAPSNIADAVRVGEAKETGNGRYIIDVSIPLKEAPAAAAYEWGSGEHAERGARGEYPIPSDGETDMFFPKEDWPQYSPPPPAPNVFKFRHVMHPGVSKRPYIQPAIVDTLEEAKIELGKAILQQFLITGETAKGKHYEVIIVGKQ